MKPTQILILGGTAEASALAQMLAGDMRFSATLSLAGRTSAPRAQPLPTRIGGFGGVDGFISFMRGQRIEAVVDATHPFAATIKQNAARATAALKVPLIGILRAPWLPIAGDRWQMVPDMQAACHAIGTERRNVFLTIGRQELAIFTKAPQHRYLIRSVDCPEPALLPRDAHVIVARGPFTEANDRSLLESHDIEIIVTKNSGGEATRAKLDAARALGISVIMIERPAVPVRASVATAQEALEWLQHLHGTALKADRGV